MSYGYGAAYGGGGGKPPFPAGLEGDRSAVQGYGDSQTRGFQEGPDGGVSQQHSQVKSGYSQQGQTGRNRDTADAWQSWGSAQDSGASMTSTGQQRMQDNAAMASTGQLHRCELCNIGFNEREVMLIFKKKYLLKYLYRVKHNSVKYCFSMRPS